MRAGKGRLFKRPRYRPPPFPRIERYGDCPYAHTGEDSGSVRRKWSYKTEAAAELALEKMRRGAVLTYEELAVYKCHKIDHWHIGRNRRRDHLQEEWDALQRTLEEIKR